MMTIGRDHLSKADAITIAAIEAGLPTLVEARQSIDRFHEMVRRKIRDDLTPWLQAARGSLVVSFANGIAKDEAAVRAAIATSWSNGQTEGQVITAIEVTNPYPGGYWEKNGLIPIALQYRQRVTLAALIFLPASYTRRPPLSMVFDALAVDDCH